MSGFARAAASVPAGTIIQLATPTVPNGYLACNGILLPQAGKYARLFAAIQHSHKKSTETTAALNAAGKFRVPNDYNGTNGIFHRSTLPAFVIDGSTSWAGNGITTDTKSASPTYAFAKRLEQDLADVGAMIFSRGIDFAAKPAGKYYIPYRLTGAPSNIVVSSHSIAIVLKNGPDFFRFETIIEKQAGGVVERYHRWTKYVAGVITAQTVAALETAAAPSHTMREWVFYWDTAGNAGVMCNGIGYPSPVAFPTHVTTWVPRVEMYVLPGATGTIDMAITEAEALEVTDVQTQLAGYVAGLGITKTYGVGATSGAETHAHTVGGTALTIAQMPAHTHDVTGFVVNNASTSGGGPNDTPTNVIGTKTTTSQGSGATHTHTMTTESNLPPFMRSLFAIKY